MAEVSFRPSVPRLKTAYEVRSTLNPKDAVIPISIFRQESPGKPVVKSENVQSVPARPDWPEGQSNGYGEYRTCRASKRTTQRGLLQSTQRPPPGKVTV